MDMDEVGCMVHFKFSIFIIVDPHALDAKFDLEVDDGNKDNNLDISQDEDEKKIKNWHTPNSLKDSNVSPSIK